MPRNIFDVKVTQDGYVKMRPTGLMTLKDALNLAAWIVALLDPEAEEFNTVLDEILETEE